MLETAKRGVPNLVVKPENGFDGLGLFDDPPCDLIVFWVQVVGAFRADAAVLAHGVVPRCVIGVTSAVIKTVNTTFWRKACKNVSGKIG